MDLLSASASVVNVIEGVSLLVKYLKDLKVGGEQRQYLYEEIVSTSTVLNHLKVVSQITSTTGGHDIFKALFEPGGIIEQCHGVVLELLSSLGSPKKRSERLIQTFKWSFSKDEVQHKVNQLHRFQTVINVAIAQANFTISQEILSTGIANRELLEEQETQKVRRWLSQLPSKVQRLSLSCCPGIGTSFLQSRGFKDWVATPGHTIWCQGPPGAGKTYLSTIAADSLQCDFPDAAVLVIYCQYDDPASQKPDRILVDLLRQILCGKRLPEKLIQQFRKDTTLRSELSLELLVELLTEELRSFSRIFIIVDGADEISNITDRHKVLDLVRTPTIGANVLINSRQLEDIKTSLAPTNNLCDGCQKDENARDHHFMLLYRCFGGCDFDVCEACYEAGISCPDKAHTGLTQFRKNNFLYFVHPTPKDLERYVEWRVNSNVTLHSFVSANPELKDELVQVALIHSRSSFLLIRLLLDSLSSCLTAKRFKEMIADVPRSLEVAYESTLRRIDQQPEEWSQVAYEAMVWIAFARRPLTVSEIEHAIAAKIEARSFDVDDIVPGQRIVDLCCGLIFISGAPQVRFVHSTVQEYIGPVLNKKVGGGESLVAKKCLSYLQLDNLAGGPCLSKKALEDRNANLPLLSYCATYWGRHSENAKDEAVDRLGNNLLASEGHWQAAYQFCNYFGPGKPVLPIKIATPLHYAAAVGSMRIFDGTVSHSAYDESKAEETGLTPLMFAACNNDTVLVKKLLDLDVNANLQDSRGMTALHLAAQRGHADATRTLIRSSKLDLNVLDEAGLSAMTRSFMWGHHDIALEIWHAGANINRQSGQGSTMLGEALFHHLQIVKTLIENQDCDVNQFSAGLSPLMIAAANGYQEGVELLLQAPTINVNAQRPSDGETALMMAISNRKVEIALLLIADQRIAVDICMYTVEAGPIIRKGWTALLYAVNTGDTILVDALLERGASFGLVAEDCWSSLLIAAWRNNTELLLKLLALQVSMECETDALSTSNSVPTEDEIGLEAQEYALTCRECVNKERSIALLYAVDFENVDTAEILLMHGASMDFREGPDIPTPAEYALYRDKTEILDLFRATKPKHPLFQEGEEIGEEFNRAKNLVQEMQTVQEL